MNCNRNLSFFHCRFNLLGDTNSKAQPAQIERFDNLSAIERGASGISLEALQRLCRLLGVSADRIIFGVDDPESEVLALARCISDMKPEYRQQVQNLLSAILQMS